MERDLTSLRCRCGVYFRSNRRGLKRLRCRKCGLGMEHADAPLLLIAATYLQKILVPLLPDHTPGPKRAQYGEFIRVRAGDGGVDFMHRLSRRIAHSLEYMSRVGISVAPHTLRTISSPHYGYVRTRRPVFVLGWKAWGCDNR